MGLPQHRLAPGPHPAAPAESPAWGFHLHLFHFPCESVKPLKSGTMLGSVPHTLVCTQDSRSRGREGAWAEVWFCYSSAEGCHTDNCFYEKLHPKFRRTNLLMNLPNDLGISLRE